MKDRKLPDLRSMTAKQTLDFADRYRADPDPVRRWLAAAARIVITQMIHLMKATHEHKKQLRENEERQLVERTIDNRPEGRPAVTEGS